MKLFKLAGDTFVGLLILQFFLLLCQGYWGALTKHDPFVDITATPAAIELIA